MSVLKGRVKRKGKKSSNYLCHFALLRPGVQEGSSVTGVGIYCCSGLGGCERSEQAWGLAK